MAAQYELGSLVTVKVNGQPYLGTVLTYDEEADPIMYKLSVNGLGDVVAIDEDTLSEDNESEPST